MEINNKLNFVVPVETSIGTIYVHSMPISTETFDRYFMVIAKTFSAIHALGLGHISGPRVSAKLLKNVAEEMGTWEGTGGVQAGLMGEIYRLTNVVMPGEKGWQTMPYEDAIKAKMLDAEDASEVENAITFFTVAWSMHRKTVRAIYVQGAAELWGGQTTSLNCTEFAASLTTSTAPVNSGVTAPSPAPVPKASLPPH